MKKILKMKMGKKMKKMRKIMKILKLKMMIMALILMKKIFNKMTKII